MSWSISRERAFLRADAAGEIAEMIDGERDVGGRRLADRLAVVDRLDEASRLRFALHAVGDLVQEPRALGGRRLAPGFARRMRGVERELDVFGGRARDLADRLAGDRADIVEILALDRRDPFAADEIVVALPQRHLLLQLFEALRKHEFLPFLTRRLDDSLDDRPQWGR